MNETGGRRLRHVHRQKAMFGLRILQVEAIFFERDRCNGCIRQDGGIRQAVEHTFVERGLPLPADATDITAYIRLHEAEILSQIAEKIENSFIHSLQTFI